MGSYTFKWEHPANEAYVTGTFDNWGKTVQLEKQGNVFQKTVDLPHSEEKVYYKFFVDNNWAINTLAPHEADKDGNVNNFLTGDDLRPILTNPFINTVTPESSTVDMAGKKSNKKKQAQKQQQATVKPAEATAADTLPAPAAVAAAVETREDTATPSIGPGGFPVTPANEEEERSFGDQPLPAAPGAVNPIHLPAGEKIPDSFAAQNVNEHVKLDKASYEKSDALPGFETETQLPPVSKNLIPESSLPMGSGQDVTINTVGAGAITTGLAGQVPLEPRVPEVVKESQHKAGAAPEASAVASEVQDKARVEEELKEKVQKAPVTSEGTAGIGSEKNEHTGLIAGAAATTGAAAVAAGVAAKDTFTERAAPAANDVTAASADSANKTLPDSFKQQLPESTQKSLAGKAKEEPLQKVSPEVPVEVKESLAEAGKNPEAAANTSAVVDKKEVEAELLKEVKPAPAVDDVKATETKTTKAAETKVPEAKPVAATTAKPVAATADKPAAVTTEAVKAGAAQKETAPAAPAAVAANGNGAESKPAESSSKPAEPSAAEKKKKNRFSAFIGKIKDKLSDK